MPILNNATFLYAKLNKPVNKYQSTDKEFTVDVCVDKATAKAWNKQFPKQKAKEFDSAEFKEIFKIDPVYSDQDEQFVIKLKRPAQYKDGKPLAEEHQPKVLIKQPNGKLKNVAKTVLVANGSKGVVEYDTTENDYGIFAKLRNIRVDELIEYKNSSSSELGDIEEDDEVSTGTALSEVAEDEPVSEEVKKPSKKVSKPVDDEDEDSPF
jgi:hypothetical protein